MTDHRHLIAFVAALAAGITLGLAAAMSLTGEAETREALGLTGLTLLIAVVSTVPIRLRVDAAVPLSAAVVMALPGLIDPAQALAVVLVAAALTAGARAVEFGLARGRDTAVRLTTDGLAVVGAGTALLAEWPDLDAAVVAMVCSCTYVMADLAVTRVVRADGYHLDPMGASTAYLTLASSAVLIAMTTDRVGVAMAVAAALPLLVTRFSFERYSDGDEALRQTVQALGLVPELSGQAPLGHSERSAHYADAISRQLRLGRSDRERIVTATRLTRLGAVQYDPPAPGEVDESKPATPAEVALAAGKVLRDAGFPTDVAELIEAAKVGTDANAPSIDAAVVKVAVAFDEIVGRDPSRADHALALVTGGARDGNTRRVAAQLHQLVATRPATVGQAVAAGEVFQEAADGLDLDQLMVSGGGTLVPFVRRRG